MKSITASRVNRRSLVLGGGAATAFSVVDDAIAQPSHSRSRQAATLQSGNLPTPREETFVIDVPPVNVWDSFNPFIPNGEAFQYGIGIIARESLFYVNFATGEVTPWLGREYTYNEDFTSCTLTLNPDVRWNDGEPFTAHDVVFSQQLLFDNPSLNGAAGLIASAESVVADDDHTVTWTLLGPDTRFHYRFLAGVVSDGIRIMPRHIWEGEDPGTFKFNPPVQTGPYTLVEASSTKLHYLWEKNEDYWNKAELDPEPRYVLYRQWTDVDASVQEFLAGNVDDSHRLALDFINQEVVATQTDQVSRYNFNDPCPRGFYLNVDSPSGLFRSPEGRWAMSCLIDRETIGTTIWQPPSRAATYPWADYDSWAEWAPDEVMSQYDLSFSIDRANEILDGMGATERDGDGIRILDGTPLKLTMITPAETTGPEYQMGLVVAQSAREAGLDIELKAMPGSAHWDAFDRGEYDISSHWICGMSFDPFQLYTWYHSDNYLPVGEQSTSGNNVRLQSDELDALIDQLAELDPESPESRPVFDDTLNVFMQELPAVPSIQTIFPVFFSTSIWDGWPTEEDPYSVPLFWWAHYLFVIGRVTRAGTS